MTISSMPKTMLQTSSPAPAIVLSALLARDEVTHDRVPLFFRSSRSGRLSVLCREPGGGGDVRDRGLQLVLPAAHHIAVAAHHRVEAGLRHVGGVVFFLCADLGVHHVGALKEIGLGRTRHEARYGHAGVLQLMPDGEAEGVDEGFAAVVDGLVAARREACDRTGDEDATVAARPHLAPDFLHEINGTGDIHVNDVAAGLEVLIEERAA
jgi:hypothetical protein